MKYTRETDPVILTQIEPHLDFIVDYSRLNFLRAIMEMMNNRPEQIYICVARQGKTLRGFIIAQAPAGESHVWIAQAWSDLQNDWKVSEEVLNRVRIWTAAIGRKTIRAETRRNVEAFSRRFSFDPIAQIVEHKVPEDLLERIDNGKP